MLSLLPLDSQTLIVEAAGFFFEGVNRDSVSDMPDDQ